MALIKTTAIIAEIRGKVAGTVFSRNASGAYMRTKVTPINPQTTAQSLVRQNFTDNSQTWRGLTENQRKLWNQSAINFTRTNIFGDNVPLSGFNLYVRLNNNLKAVNVAVIADAPQPESVQGFTTLSVVADTGGGTFDITFTPPIAANVSVQVFATAPLSAGVTFVKTELRKIDVLVTADTTPQDLAAEYITKFGALPPVGSKIFIQFTPINTTTGQAGGTLKASALAI